MTVETLHPFVDGIDTAGDAPWLAALRQKALASYKSVGLPTPKTEAWKFTNLRKLARQKFTSAPDTGLAESIKPLDIDCYRAVLVNGRFRADLSDLDGLPAGVICGGLADHLDTAEPLLGKVAHRTGLPLAALNTAHLRDGVFVNTGDGVVLDKPIQIVSIGSGSDISFYPRILVDCGRDSQLTLLESHMGTGTYFTNIVSEVLVAKGAVLNHYKVQDDSDSAFHIATTDTVLHDRAVYDNFVLQIGAELARNDAYSALDGEHIECRMSGAYVAGGKQHLDNTTFIDHMQPNCRSREVYKGVLDGSSRGVFQGKILVRKDAQKTDGHQLNKALLLSRGAEIDAKPELEIYADDVKCSHGATAGDLDEDALFYLCARGIDPETAKNMLIAAFVGEAVDEIQNPAIREIIAGLVNARLGNTTEEVAA